MLNYLGKYLLENELLWYANPYYERLVIFEMFHPDR
jgi:hypothetical protein